MTSMIIDRKHFRSRNIPLQWLILLAFVVQIFGAVGLVAYLSYRSGQDSANKLAIRKHLRIDSSKISKHFADQSHVDKGLRCVLIKFMILAESAIFAYPSESSLHYPTL